MAVCVHGRACEYRRDQVDHDFAVAGPDVSDQDLVATGVERAATAAETDKSKMDAGAATSAVVAAAPATSAT